MSCRCFAGSAIRVQLHAFAHILHAGLAMPQAAEPASLTSPNPTCVREHPSGPDVILVYRSSNDGDTAIVGGPSDNHATGATWVFTRSRGAWSERTKLVGSGAVANLAPSVFAIGRSAKCRTMSSAANRSAYLEAGSA